MLTEAEQTAGVKALAFLALSYLMSDTRAAAYKIAARDLDMAAAENVMKAYGMERDAGMMAQFSEIYMREATDHVQRVRSRDGAA